MKRTILFLAAAIVAALVVVGCCDCRKSRKLEKPLVGTEWQLVQIMGREVQPSTDSYTILFHDNGTATGAGDCNRFTATFTVTSSRALTIDNLGATRRLCPNHEAESEFFDVLESVTHYEMDATNMILLRNGTLVAIMRAVPATE